MADSVEVHFLDGHCPDLVAILYIEQIAGDGYIQSVLCLLKELEKLTALAVLLSLIMHAGQYHFGHLPFIGITSC
jgi:type III secretory pathway component EscU